MFHNYWPEHALTWLLSSQHTALAEQEPLLPTPTTVIGLQVRPTMASTSWTTMPSPLRMLAIEGSLACIEYQCSYSSAYIDAKRAKIGRTNLPDGLAALDGRGGTRASRLITSLKGGGGRKNGESSEGECSNARKHIRFGE